MKSATISKAEHGTHKPLVTSSNLVAATIPLQPSLSEQGTRQNQKAYLATASEQGISVSKAIEGFLFACKGFVPGNNENGQQRA
jgi:hypothetical protein